MDEERIDAIAALLRAQVVSNRWWLSGDDRIAAESAAEILGVAVATLEKWRGAGNGPAFFRFGGGGHRVSYRLRDLAEYIQRSRVG